MNHILKMKKLKDDEIENNFQIEIIYLNKKNYN